MIRFSNIYEGVLSGVDTGLNDMDKGLEAAIQEKLYSLFPSINDRSSASRNSHAIIIKQGGVSYGGIVLEKFIKECCTIDSNVLTIDLSKHKDGASLTVEIFPKQTEEQNILIKVLDHPDRAAQNDIYNIYQKRIDVTINILNPFNSHGYNINLKKIIHPGTIVKSVQFGGYAWADYKNTILTDSAFPGKITDIAIYNCVVKKFTKIPDTVQITRPVMVDIISNKLKTNFSNIAIDNVRTSITLQK